MNILKHLILHSTYFDFENLQPELFLNKFISQFTNQLN